MKADVDSILYYPSMDFIDCDWVKRSLMYWDYVYRIVPDGYHPDDGDDIRTLVDAGLIRNIAPTQHDVELSYLAYVKMASKGRMLPSGLTSDDIEFVHEGKVYERLVDLFKKFSKDVLRQDEWIQLPLPLARSYMFTLAMAIAKRKGFVRGTDNTDVWSVSPFFTEKGNFPDLLSMESKGIYAAMTIRDILPANIGDMPSETIISFSYARKAEKQEFRARVTAMLDRLPSLDSAEEARDEIDKLSLEFETIKNEYVAVQKETLKMEKLGAFLSVGLPLAVSVFGAFPEVNDTYRSLGSISIGGIASYLNFHNAKKRRDPSLASYLIGIDEIAKNLPSISTQNLEEYLVD